MLWWQSARNWAGHSGRKRLETRCFPGGPADGFDWMRDDRAGHQCRCRRPPNDCARPGCFLCRCRVGGQHLCSLLRRTVAPRGFNRRSFRPAEGVSRRGRLFFPLFAALRGRAQWAGPFFWSRRPRGGGRGFSSAPAPAGLVVGVAAFAAFVAAESRSARPMLDLSLFRIPRFIGAVIAMFAYAASAQVMASLLPLYLQNGLGRPPLDAGFAMLPFASAMLILPQIGRRLGRRLASHWILALGLTIVCLCNLITAWAAGAGPWPFVILGMPILRSRAGLLN